MGDFEACLYKVYKESNAPFSLSISYRQDERSSEFYTSWLPRESDHLMHPIHLLECSHSQFHPAA